MKLVYNLLACFVACFLAQAWISIIPVFAQTSNHRNNLVTNKQLAVRSLYSSVKPIDDHISYGFINLLYPEWVDVVNASDHRIPAPFQFWFRCIENQVRVYFFVEDLRGLTHIKEADMPVHGHLHKKVRFTIQASGLSDQANYQTRIEKFETWFGGGQFYFEFPTSLQAAGVEHLDLRMDGVRHYTRFPLSTCTKATPNMLPPASLNPNIPPEKLSKADIAHIANITSTKPKYIMHIHLREYLNATNFNRRIIEGVLRHMTYHRCALLLDSYEIVIQKEQVPIFLENPRIAMAVRKGWLNILTRNPVVPGGMTTYDPSNCYWQAYTENLALLRHWGEHARIYFWDSDEYVVFPDSPVDIAGGNAAGYTPQEYFQMVNTENALGIERYMSFCVDCPRDRPELRHFSFTNSRYAVIQPKLMHPKLAVNPNKVGCYIVHWAGCGVPTKVLSEKKIYILHFENIYLARWHKSKEELLVAQRFNNTKVNNVCDPGKFDFRSPLPSIIPRS